METNGKKNIGAFFRNLLIVNRYELTLSGILTIFWPIFLLVQRVEEIFSLKVLITFIVCMLIRHTGFLVNALADYELDKTNIRKKLVTSSMNSIGVTNLKYICVVQYAITLGILVLMNNYFNINNQALYIVLLADIINVILYNHKLTKFKGKGILNSLCMTVRTFINTYLVEIIVFKASLGLGLNILALGVILDVAAGAIFVAIFDAESDKKFGLKTIPVKYGPLFAMRSAVILKAVGVISLLIGWFFLAGSFRPSFILLAAVNAYAMIDYSIAVIKSKEIQQLLDLFKQQNFRKRAFVWWGGCRIAILAASFMHLFKF